MHLRFCDKIETLNKFILALNDDIHNDMLIYIYLCETGYEEDIVQLVKHLDIRGRLGV